MPATRAAGLAVLELVGLAQAAVEGRLRRHVYALISQLRNDLLRRQVAVLRAVCDLQYPGTFDLAELVLRHAFRPSSAIFAAIRMLTPTLQHAAAHAQALTCTALSGTSCHGLIDKHQDHLPLLGAVLSSSSPQMASAFFLSTSNAAVSANAAFLRLSSRSSLRTCFSASLCSRLFLVLG